MPSVAVVGLCAVVAIGAFILLRPGSGPLETRLTEAVDSTLERGGHYTAVTHTESPQVKPPDDLYEGDLAAGLRVDDLAFPASLLSNVEGAPGVDVVGTEQIDGMAMTHYSASVDPDWQVEQSREHLDEVDAPDEARSVAEGSILEIQSRPPQLEVWVDESGYVRRFIESEALKNGVTAATTIEFSRP